MTTRMFSIAALLVIGLVSSAAAQDKEKAAAETEEALKLVPNREHGISVYEVCADCHGYEGWGRKDGSYPQIAGQHASVIIKQLADFRAKNRDNLAMVPFSGPEDLGGTQSLADVAAYIESLPMSDGNGVGDGTQLALGGRLYHQHCVRCHGKEGEGSAKYFYPRLQGQHYKYLVRQFEWIRTGRRRNAHPEMVQQIDSFKPGEITAVMDYVSRFKPPQDKLAKPGWQNPDFK